MRAHVTAKYHFLFSEALTLAPAGHENVSVDSRDIAVDGMPGSGLSHSEGEGHQLYEVMGGHDADQGAQVTPYRHQLDSPDIGQVKAGKGGERQLAVRQGKGGSDDEGGGTHGSTQPPGSLR